jgi:hypothetical protein
MIELLKRARRKIFTSLRLRPMHAVMRKLRRLGFKRFERALEVFGYEGWYHTIHYAGMVDHLEVWEIDPKCELPLRRNLPRARITIGDSYQLIKDAPKNYDLIVVDNHQGLFGHGYCEHFEIIDEAIRHLSGNSAIILNLIPRMDQSMKMTNAAYYTAHLARRSQFYGRQAESLDDDFIHRFYRERAEKLGFKVEHSFRIKRNYLMHYFVLTGTSSGHRA